MDVHFVLHGQRFVWNERKASINLVKHRIGFEDACEIFFDPLLRFVDASSDGEAREAAIGATDSRRVLFVVHAVLEADVIRLISARPITAEERRFYEDYE